METQTNQEALRPQEGRKAESKSAAETAREYQKRGEEETKRVLEELAQQEALLKSSDAGAAEMEQLQTLKGEAQAALEELKHSLGEPVEEIDASMLEEEPEELSAELLAEEPAAESAAETGEEEARLADEMFLEGNDGIAMLEQLAEASAGHAKRREMALAVMKEKVGKYAEQLLDSPELRKELAELKQTLDGTWGEDGPRIAGEMTLDKLLAVKETLGNDPKAFLEVMDIRRQLAARGQEAQMQYDTFENAIEVYNPTVDKETGELQTRMDVGFSYQDPSGETVMIKRGFTRKVEKDAEGNSHVKKSVKHEQFQLPSYLKANGLAAEVTQQSLKEYDKQGIDDIKLYADIDMGGYAWAAYGYGWDKDAMAKNYLAFKENADKEVSTDNGKKKIKDLSDAEKTKLAVSQREALAKESIAGVVKKAQENLARVFRETQFAGADQALQPLKDLESNLVSVTPQTLAEMGRKGPIFYRDTYNNWYSEDSLKEKLSAGEITAEEAEELKKKPCHAGKIAMMFNDWPGKIELKPDGEQGGKNRKGLENISINRSRKGKPNKNLL